LRDVHAAAAAVLDATGSEQVAAFGLDPARWATRLRSAVLLSAALHDLGKANDHFQRMLRSPAAVHWLRHEWATLLILLAPGWSEWLAPALVDPTDWDCVLWSVAGNHPAHGRTSPPTCMPPGCFGAEVNLVLGHADFAASLKWLRQAFSLGTPPACADVGLSLSSIKAGDAFKRLAAWRDAADERWRGEGDERKRFVAAVKACLIAADVAGSALPRAGLPGATGAAWITDSLIHGPDDAVWFTGHG
jgi:CRISPR-associated endonuclease/helicase Cas3